MKLKKISYHIFCLVMLISVFNSGCKKETPIEEIPRNRFYGVADGLQFENTSPKVWKDKDDLFTIVGTAANGISIFAVVNGRDNKEYPVTQGNILATAQTLDTLTSLDTSFTETVILLVGASLNNLPVGESFVLLFSNDDVFYSYRGSITLTDYDGSINRIFGEFDIEAFNLIGGPKYIQATFEDVFFTDCPDPGLCFI